MAEVLVQFSDPVVWDDGKSYIARACGAEMPDGMWQGWIEFLPMNGGEVLRSARETTQPNRSDAMYWATGLTAVYLEGALKRALNPLVRADPPPVMPPLYDEPAPDLVPRPAPSEGILDPFSVYRQGEASLRSRLMALSPWHLVNIIRANGLSEQSAEMLDASDGPALVELIVSAVRERAAPTATR